MEKLLAAERKNSRKTRKNENAPRKKQEEEPRSRLEVGKQAEDDF